MILIISLGLAVMIICLAVQMVSVALVGRYYASASQQPIIGHALMTLYWQLARTMILLLISGLLQMAAWAGLYRALDQFEDFETALYFSGVTFTSLGYGDLTLPKQFRMLSAMEAADGLMMFGVTSAVFMIALQHTITRLQKLRKGSDKN